MNDVLRASQVRGLQEKENITAKRWWDNKHSPHEPVRSETKGETGKCGSDTPRLNGHCFPQQKITVAPDRTAEADPKQVCIQPVPVPAAAKVQVDVGSWWQRSGKLQAYAVLLLTL